MNRLTHKDATGRNTISHDGSVGKFVVWYECSYPMHLYGRAVDRLSAYEDTGLTPEQVVELASMRALLEKGGGA